MKRILIAVAIIATVITLPVVNASSSTSTASINSAALVVPASSSCQLFSTQHVAIYAARIYSGIGSVTASQVRHLKWEETCLRYPNALAWIKHWAHERAVKHQVRVMTLSRLPSAGASWYEDAGSTACGFHALYGVANKTLPCGTKVLFIYHGQRIEAVVQDRGPYIDGREWDLNQTLAAALGFEGIDMIQYRIGG